MRVRATRWLLAVVAVLLAALTLVAPGRSWSTAPVVAQAVGARAALAASMLVVAVLLLLLRRRRRHDARRRERRVLATAVAIALVATAVAHAAVVGARGWGAGSPPDADTERPDEVTVLVVNVHKGGLEVERSELVDIVLDAGVDVIAVPESSSWFRGRLREDLAAAGADFVVFDGGATGSPSYGSALLVRRSLGPYREVATDAPGVVRVTPQTGDGPELAVAHPISPPLLALSPSGLRQMRRWVSELDDVRTLAATMPGGVVLGDMNATIDHAPLADLPGGYVDAADVRGIGGHGTFPSWLPGPLGAAIDHVLLDGDALTATAAALVDVDGTDHRGLIVRLAPR